MDLRVVMAKVNSLLLFFDGELRTVGSTFSPSKLSQIDDSNARLDSTLLDELAEPLPRGDFATIPNTVSTRTCWRFVQQCHTILAVLRAGEMLEPWVIERSKRHPHHWGVLGHCNNSLNLSTRSGGDMPPCKPFEDYADADAAACGHPELSTSTASAAFFVRKLQSNECDEE